MRGIAPPVLRAMWPLKLLVSCSPGTRDLGVAACDLHCSRRAPNGGPSRNNKGRCYLLTPSAASVTLPIPLNPPRLCPFFFLLHLSILTITVRDSPATLLNTQMADYQAPPGPPTGPPPPEVPPGWTARWNDQYKAW